MTRVFVTIGVLAAFMLGALVHPTASAAAAEKNEGGGEGYCAKNSVSATLLKDCKKLLLLKDRLDPSGVLNWDRNVKVKGWTGIRVNEDGTAVTVLELLDQGLTGEIPPRLSQLTGLVLIDLSYNRLTGSIPPELGKLTNLKELRMPRVAQ